MKNRYAFLLLALGLSTVLLNCNCKRLCSSGVPTLKFVNFDSASLHIIVVKQYNNNGQFTDLEHTQVYMSFASTSSYMPGPDTAQFDTGRISLEYSNDYVIEMPATGRTWYLKGVTLQPAKMNEAHCTNGIKYYLNDTLHTVPAAPTAPYGPVYIELNK